MSRSLARRFQFRTLLKVDFSCALSAGLIYHFFTGLIIETFSLPYGLVATQIVANISYGLFGGFLFFSRAPISKFRVLVTMNFAYALFCLVASATLLGSGKSLGALLLLAEGLFVFGLAHVESKSI